MDIMTSILAANRAKKSLEKSGQIGYETPSTDILNVELTKIDDGSSNSEYWDYGRIHLVDGVTYQVNFDGRQYQSVCKTIIDEFGKMIYLGNLFLSTNQEDHDNGEPYIISEYYENSIWNVYILDTNNSTSCIITAPDIVHTIDPKYLPSIPSGDSDELARIKADGGVGYTEGSIIELVPEGTYEFNQGECTISIPEIYNAGTEIIITIDGIRYSSISKLVSIDEQRSDHIVVAGNGSILGLINTGEPYMVIMRSTENDVTLTVDLYAERESAQTTQHKISVSINNGVIHTINPKYIHRPVFHFEDFGLPFFPTEAIEINEETATNIIKLLSSPSAHVQINNLERGEEDTTTILDFPVISSVYIKSAREVHFMASLCRSDPLSRKILNAAICISKSRNGIWTFEYILQQNMGGLTAEDKQAIANQVLTMLPSGDEVSY